MSTRHRLIISNKCRTLMLLALLPACGGGGLFTTTPATTALSDAGGSAKEFHFGSDYPAGLVIPDIDGMRGTAFVVSVDNPPGVVAIDLDSNPLGLSSTFQTCRAPAGSGIPTGALVVESATRLFFLTSTHLIDCDPSLGRIRSATALLEQITLPHAYALSSPYDVDDNGSTDISVQSFTLGFPGGLAVMQNRAFISFSNYLLPIGEPVAAPGIVMEYRVMDSAPFVERTGTPFVTSAFNPTALRALPDGRLLIVNSGLNAIVNDRTTPRTESGIDLYNPATHQTQWIGLGPVALAFAPPALTADGARAFVTSASYGEVYQIDLNIPEVIRGHDDPITVTSNQVGGDFLTAAALDATQQRLFVASFQHSAIYSATLNGLDVAVSPTPIVLGNAGAVSADNPSGTTTGVGAIAMRAGIRGIDFTGPDLFALTAFPGKLVAVDTLAPSQSSSSPDGDERIGTGTNVSDEQVVPEQVVPVPNGSFSGPATPSTSGNATPPSAPTAMTTAVACGTTAFADAVASFLPGSGAGYGGAQFPANVLGPPHGGTATAPYVSPTELLSLGCGGSIILEMQDCTIADGPGADFIVFENAFQYGKSSLFAEPAVVGVSYYGNTFAEFPCQPNAASTYAGCAGVHPTLSNADNGVDPTDSTVAGGDAFDLATVGVSKARFVRIRDVSCSNGASPTAGFDLDAVSVVWSDN